MDYQNLTDPVYSPGAPADTGAMKVFSDMVHSYLDLVQRNAFPPDFLAPLLKTPPEVEYKEVLMYEIGYLVALAIGLVFIILMTLVGLFFACCRCCGNCGGKMYQKQTKKIDCKRRFIYFFLLIITLTILAGDICAFYSNSKVDNAIDNSFTTFNKTLNNIKTYINTVPKDVDIIINSSSVPINKANSSIIDIGPILGGMIKTRIEGPANKTLSSVQGMVNDLNNTAKALVTVNNTFNSLKDEQRQLVTNLGNVQGAINDIVARCGGGCTGAPPTSDLVIDANFTTIPDFSSQLKTINTFLDDSGIEGTIQDARQTINDIPGTVTNQTRSSVKSVQDQLVNIKQKITDARSSIPVVDSLDNINSFFDTAANYSEQYKPQVVQYNYYRWIVGICLSCIILLVVVCNLFGLMLGPCGHKSSVDPTNRSCASNSGGDFFMAGAAFSFIFAWLLMLITAILFVVGGNVYTSFCKPWANQQLYKVVDDHVNISEMVNIGDVNLSITNIYKDCQKNTALWTALNLNSLINLDSYLNISQYTGDVNTTLENTNISVSHITFLSDAQKNQVTDVATSGIDTLDFSNISGQMTKNITKTNLTAYAINLKIFAAKAPGPYNTQLEDEAKTILAIQDSIDTKLLPQVKNMNTSIANLQATSTKLPKSLNTTLNAVDQTQTFVDTQVVGIVTSETRAFLDTILKYFESYINWTKTMLTTKLARCGPVASAMDSAQVVVCQYLVDSLNAFWFSIGWCTIFFIPSIILSVKLAKYYRRMESSDTYDNPNDHLEMTSTSQQFLIPRVTTRS